MKEIYSFVPKANQKNTVNALNSPTTRVFFAKPSMASLEEAEFFYGQKFNEYINAGFLTKAMLSKKMGDIGGLSSKIVIASLQKAIIDNINASKVIEFYKGSLDLSEEQADALREAEETFAATKTQVNEYELSLRSQFSQTADARAEQKLIEWLVFHQSFYEEQIGEKKQTFPLFTGDSFEEKNAFYLTLCENKEDIDDNAALKIKPIFDASFETLVRVASIWYNKIAENQDSIDKALKEMFEDENIDEQQQKLENVQEQATTNTESEHGAS